jgi:hypothetical protein
MPYDCTHACPERRQHRRLFRHCYRDLRRLYQNTPLSGFPGSMNQCRPVAPCLKRANFVAMQPKLRPASTSGTVRLLCHKSPAPPPTVHPD